MIRIISVIRIIRVMRIIRLIRTIRYEDYCIEGKFLSKEEHSSFMKEIYSMHIALKLIDDRTWVRKIGKQEKEAS